MSYDFLCFLSQAEDILANFADEATKVDQMLAEQYGRESQVNNSRLV